MGLVSLDNFLNLRGHLGHAVFSVSARYRLAGKRDGRVVFDFGNSIFGLRKALNFVLIQRVELDTRLTDTKDNIESSKLFIIVQSPLMAIKLNSLFLVDSLANVKIFYNWISGSLTRGDSMLARTLNLSSKRKKLSYLPFMVVLLGSYKVMQPIALESFYLRIPTTAVVDSQYTGREVTYPIFANDDSEDFLFFVGSLFILAMWREKKDSISSFLIE
jgi:ribosomal protein S2